MDREKTKPEINALQRKNRRVALSVLTAVLLMTGMAFASVPLYNLFCRVTGYGGTTQTAEALPDRISERIITVRFNADTAPDMPWIFKPEQREVQTHPGARTLIAYHAKSKADIPVAGTALYNVSPPKAGRYFHKIECFCFGEQILNPGEDVSMPVVFFIDPEIDNDPGMKDVTTITLSYTFFKTETEALDKALEDFYNQSSSGEKDDQS
ncbi:MAG: cytochrome c oxidase assembly protein [Rhodospirillales bacterium]|nr:cytochrome c oxidase assembly protein [Rhodospirillales bacterium]MCB9996185.1 cytochrome c oxidase assembly protein [Rhodospirillales bacterium]